MPSRSLQTIITTAGCLLWATLAWAQPSQEAYDFIQQGERPYSQPVNPNITPHNVLAQSGPEGLVCLVGTSTLAGGLLCEYSMRALRTYARERARFCDRFTDRVQELGEGDHREPSDPGTQQCRHIVGRVRELERRIRSGQMRAEGVAEAVGNIQARVNSEVRAWMSQRRRAQATCRTSEQRADLDTAWNGLLRCTRDLNQALESIASARGPS